jgi:hypothetical protein
MSLKKKLLCLLDPQLMQDYNTLLLQNEALKKMLLEKDYKEEALIGTLKK